MRIRITAKFASYFLASFFRTFVSYSLSHLLTNTREQSVLQWKSELDRVPSLYEKKNFPPDFRLFHLKTRNILRTSSSTFHLSRFERTSPLPSPPLPKLRYPRAILYSAEFFEARRRDHREIGNSGRRRRVKKEGSERGAKSYVCRGEGDVRRRVETCGERGDCSVPLARVEDFLPSPPSDPIDDIRESAHVSSITATS